MCWLRHSLPWGIVPTLAARAARIRPWGIPTGLLTMLLLAGCGALVSPNPPIQATYSTHVTAPTPTPNTTSPYYRNALRQPAPPAGWASTPVCSFTPQGLVVKPSGGQAYICLVPTAPIADVAITVTVQQLSGSPDHAFGIAFRHSAPKSYYFFGVDSHGHYTLAVVVNDVSHTVIPFTPNAAIHAGAAVTNVLQVVMRGQHVTLFVNGAAVASATLTTFATGTVGLRGVNDGQVRFTALTLVKA